MAKDIKLVNETDKIFISIRNRWVYFDALIDNTGKSFKIDRDELIKKLKR